MNQESKTHSFQMRVKAYLSEKSESVSGPPSPLTLNKNLPSNVNHW